jgi:hypothetical protein
MPHRPDIGRCWKNILCPAFTSRSAACISVMRRRGVCCLAHSFNGDFFDPIRPIYARGLNSRHNQKSRVFAPHPEQPPHLIGGQETTARLQTRNFRQFRQLSERNNAVIIAEDGPKALTNTCFQVKNDLLPRVIKK